MIVSGCHGVLSGSPYCPGARGSGTFSMRNGTRTLGSIGTVTRKLIRAGWKSPGGAKPNSKSYSRSTGPPLELLLVLLGVHSVPSAPTSAATYCTCGQ